MAWHLRGGEGRKWAGFGPSSPPEGGVLALRTRSREGAPVTARFAGFLARQITNGLNGDALLIDGRNRREACRLVKVEPTTVQAPRAFAISFPLAILQNHESTACHRWT